jgi:hypothetical protein
VIETGGIAARKHELEEIVLVVEMIEELLHYRCELQIDAGGELIGELSATLMVIASKWMLMVVGALSNRASSVGAMGAD